MIAKSLLSVGEFMACPYGSSGKLAHEYPGARLFDSRRHFIVGPSVSHVALYATFVNEGVFRSTPRGVKALLDFRLTDVSCSVARVVSSRMVRLHMTRKDYAWPMRVDLAVGRGELDVKRPYRAEILSDAGDVIASLDLLFFSPQEIGMAPTAWFYPLGGGVRSVSGAMLRSPGVCADEWADVVFSLENHLPAGSVAGVPEMQMLLTDPRGRVQSVFTCPERTVAGPTGRVDWEAAARFSLDNENKGVYYAELRCMTYPLAGFLFSTVGEAVGGRWAKSELLPAVNYTLGWGYARFAKLYERVSRRPLMRSGMMCYRGWAGCEVA